MQMLATERPVNIVKKWFLSTHFTVFWNANQKASKHKNGEIEIGWDCTNLAGRYNIENIFAGSNELNIYIAAKRSHK